MARLKFISIIFVFLSPFLFAQYFYTSNVTETRGTTNHGTFLPNEIIIEVESTSKNEYWTILQILPLNCNKKCQNDTHIIRQINTALGKDMDRVKRYILKNTNSNKNYIYLNNYPKVVVLDNSQTLYNRLSNMEERVFIADPFGKIILGYKEDFNAKGLLKDIKKLLKYSKI